MDDSHREIASPLDPRVCVHQMDVLPVDADRGLPGRSLDDETGAERKGGSNREQVPHRCQSASNQTRACGQPEDAERQARDPTRRRHAAHNREAGGPVLALRRLHEQDGSRGAARRAEESGEQVCEIEFGHRPARCHREQSDPRPKKSDEEERLAPPATVARATPQDEGGDGSDARRGRDDADVEQVPAQRVREERDQGRRRPARDSHREVRVVPVRPIRAAHPILNPLAGLGIDVSGQPQAFDAGPAAIQARLSNHVDVVFVGPSPTLNGLSVAPDVLRVIAGVSSGGALFVAQPSLSLTTDADFSGRKFATPQWGNTQDIALKHYLLVRGHRTLDEGGDVDVINAANPEILTLFKLGQIDGAWVPEPWGTRLIQEANAKVILDERDLWPGRQFVTTQLVTTKRYLERHPDVITSFLRMYVNLTLQLRRATASDLRIVNDEIYNLTTSRLKEETITAAFGNFNVTYDPIAASLETYLAWSQELGFLSRDVQPGSLYDLSLLNQVLKEKGLPPVSER